ncbi:AMP nucleosidase [Corynebacterium sp. 153RC1]|uniref:AMP nucleosidase n=1 Tax=unclassified Corynebacterium TaxID=2624378 RepID=UPI00211BD6BE|nr:MULTISPECIES: AMP nucleosidase [unclassified Corynebacterium]MCQ9371508.1 AMP nucleosidase [Corynebacterium sp. 35RC1]MCQ9352803.1 AMP nucleosidase [Corynebacterium sp. 209RC1]MCQ9355195.1 AMP nucleosidase [Corynebacterium sp. 1222RC1]MCQ9357382.1 AMP nucleosidase [Corynebacterium sp. 122RC1]MCQ9359691.1 AMP nucleosidase [Corynebacterium sp. 142RC1]
MDVGTAVERLVEIYEESTQIAREVFENGDYARYAEVVYPKLIVTVKSWHPIDRTQAYGYVDEAGVYSAVLSRPKLMRQYLFSQLERLSSNYDCEIEVVRSDVRIPPEYIDGIEGLTEARRAGDTGEFVPRPTLDDVDDAIIDGDWEAFHGPEKPLFHFTPQRFDIACARISHYTGIAPDSVQRYILFTNYAMHTREFLRFALAELSREGSRYQGLMLSDGHRIDRNAASAADAIDLTTGHQMPRLDLLAEDNMGITMINIGVGPSNAKTITDCLAVLRPEAWVMIGHCAGLDGRMRIGDLILGNAYQREDHLLDGHIPLELPIPAVPEVQKALEKSVRTIYGEDLQLMRTGTVLSTDDRNWEWHTPKKLWELLRGSTAAACDMESATLAANGYRYRIPYGTLLSVSDLPLHAVPKLPAAAQTFYANSKEAHVMCAVRAVEELALDPEKLRTRKLRRTIGEVPFR